MSRFNIDRYQILYKCTGVETGIASALSSDRALASSAGKTLIWCGVRPRGVPGETLWGGIDLVGALALTLRFVLALVDERSKLLVLLNARVVARELAGGRSRRLLRVARARMRAVELRREARVGGFVRRHARITHAGRDFLLKTGALSALAFRL